MVAAVQGELAASAGVGKLIVPPVEAAQWVQTQIERGQAIRKLRLRYAEDLEKARHKKGEWVQQTHDVLKGMFDNDSVAQEFNTWDARVLPDFVELHLFIEAFYDEMEQRLKKLQTIYRRMPVGRQGGQRANVAKAGRMTEGASIPALKVGDAAAIAPVAPMARPVAKGILVVHGEAADQVARVEPFLAKLGLGLIHSDLAGAMARLQEADGAAFVVVVTGSSDRMGADGESLFRLGCCVGRLGEGRACIVAAEGTVADIFGVNCILLDAADGWQLQLARQMRRAGVDVDLNRIC